MLARTRVTRKLLRIIFYLHPHLTLESQEAQSTAYFYIGTNVSAANTIRKKKSILS